MPFKRFKFYEKPDVRLVVMDDTVYKIKMTCQHSESRSIRMLCKATTGQSELEKVVCGVLYKDIQDPVLTDSFTVYPYKKKWSTAKRLNFAYKGKPLHVNYSMYTFYVEPRSTKEHGQTTPKQETKRRVSQQNSKRKIHDDHLEASSEEQELGNSVGQHVVLDYGQKNRHDVETQNLREQLRLQEMAQLELAVCKEEKDHAFLDEKQEETIPPSGLISTIKKFFGGS